MQIWMVQGKEDHTRIFIVVRSSSRAKSFAKLCKDFTQNNKFTITYIIKTQSWTLQDWSNPYVEPYHTRCRTLLPCMMQTQPKTKFTMYHNTNYTQTPYTSIILLKNIWFLNYNTQYHNTAAKNLSQYRKNHLSMKRTKCWLLP